MSFVCLSHASNVMSAAGDLAPLHLGSFGVRIFFILSGYLITTLLMRDRARHGGLSFGRFYFRRTLRILPPYYVYLAGVALLMVFGALPRDPAVRWLPAWLYYSNVISTRSWYIGHGWSLSVEEQFYLLWPAMFVGGWWVRGQRGAVWAAGALFVAGPLFRVLSVAGTHRVGETSPWQFDALAAGCLVALLPVATANIVRQSRVVAGVVVAAVLMQLVVVGNSFHWLVAIGIAIASAAGAIALALGIAWCVANPCGAVGRVLNWRPLRALGLISYSLYLWQQLWFAPWLGARHLGVSGLALATTGTLACAVASFWLVEQPSLRLRAWAERLLPASGERLSPPALSQTLG